MQCQSCHKELVEGAKFCKFCGAKQEAPVPELLNQEEQQDFSYPQTETKISPQEIPIASDPQKNAAESVQPLSETSSSVQPIQFGGEEQSEEAQVITREETQIADAAATLLIKEHIH